MKKKSQKSHKNHNKKHNKIHKMKTQKRHQHKAHIIKNKTPMWLRDLAQGETILTSDKKVMSSYSPTVNQELVTLQSGLSRVKIGDCNDYKAFKMEEPLKILIKNKALFGKKCAPYYTDDAKEVLLANLAANKHIDPSKIIPPKQILGNCWFNAMFVMFFISDKGRKFFHFFRQLMIEGRQQNGRQIPLHLRNAFALLNFAVDASLTGNKYAVEMDTNNIIRQIYDAIPSSYNKQSNYIPYVDEAGNPIKYYNSIINFLGNNSIQMLTLIDFTPVASWEDRINREINNRMPRHLPHIIVVEIFDGQRETAGNAGKIKNRPLSFNVKGAEYSLDSAVVRDIEQQHFCAMITCEGKQMAFDGYSYHRLTESPWKDKINSTDKWEFEGTKNYDGTPLKWSFLHSYQMLMYYRVH
jgi:hypothetical protein